MVVMFNAKTGSNIQQEKVETAHTELIPYMFKIWCSNQSGFDRAWWSELETPYRSGNYEPSTSVQQNECN